MATPNLLARCIAEHWLLYLVTANSPNSHLGLRKNRKGWRVGLGPIVIHAIHGVMVHNCKDEAVPGFS
jgi:hypothetical protein